MKRVRAVAIGVLCIALPSASSGQMSFSLDFDGRRTGESFSISSPRRSPAGPRQPSRVTRPRSGSSPSVDMQTFLNDRFQEQLREAARQREQAQLQQEMARAKALADLRTLERLFEQMQRLQINEPSVIKRMQYTEEALSLERQFDAARSAYLATLPGYRERLAASLNHINVPPPPRPLHYQRILIRGAFITPEEAARLAAGGLQNPFDGQPFDDVFAFGSTGPADFSRAALDHLVGHFERLSPATTSQIGRLKGATADEVVCHSNGCRVAQVLIATGMLKADRLRILGGDNAALELDLLRSLKQNKGLSEVSVYMLRGDPVPLVNVGWRVMDVMQKIGQPLQTFQASRATDPAYQLLGLTSRPAFEPTADVQVHVLSDPTSSALRPVAAHLYESYSRVVRGWRMSGCLEPTGAMSRKCIIY